MAEERLPQYQELLEQRQREWREVQGQADRIRRELQTQYEKMPDVADAPKTGALWTEEGIVCECTNLGFHVKRWVTVNGHRHRAELRCTACSRVRTWDFGSRRWLG